MMMAMTLTKDFDDTEEELRSGGCESMLRSRGIVTFSRLTVRGESALRSWRILLGDTSTLSKDAILVILSKSLRGEVFEHAEI
jgi:hypothetical protein